MKSNYQSKLIAAVVRNMKNGEAEALEPAEADRIITEQAELIRDQRELIAKQRELIEAQQKEITDLKRRSW